MAEVNVGNFLSSLFGSTPATQRRALAAQTDATRTATAGRQQQIDARNAIAEMMGTPAAADPSGFASAQQPGLTRVNQALQRQQNETAAQREARLAATAEQEAQAAEAERNRQRMLNASRLVRDRVVAAQEAGATPEEIGQIFDATAPIVQRVDPGVDDEALAFLRGQVVENPGVLDSIITALDPPPQAAVSTRAAQAIGAPQQVQIPGSDQVGLAVPIDMGGGEVRTEFLRDADGNILSAARFERGLAGESEITVDTPDGPQRVIIPGSAAETDVARARTETERTRQQIEETERERRGERLSSEQRVQASQDRLNLVAEQIDEAIENTSGMTAGFASLSAAVPGTPAANLAATLNTIAANVGFDELQRLRDQSPTGGALGQVTERELAFLQSVLGSIQQTQMPGQLRDRLEELKDQLRLSSRRVRQAYEEQYGVTPALGPGGVFDFRPPSEEGGGQPEQGRGAASPQFRQNPETGVWEMTDGN